MTVFKLFQNRVKRLLWCSFANVVDVYGHAIIACCQMRGTPPGPERPLFPLASSSKTKRIIYLLSIPVWRLGNLPAPDAMDVVGEPPMIDHYAAPWVAKEKYELRTDARRYSVHGSDGMLRQRVTVFCSVAVAY